jgi:cyclin E
MHRETYHLTMDFIDRYLSHKRDVPKQHLQLIGLCEVFLWFSVVTEMPNTLVTEL